MDVFFTDSTEIPLPPEEVRIRKLKVIPRSDGKQVTVYLETDPFQKRPNADISISNEQGEEISNISIIEIMDRKMDMNMHIRSPQPGTRYSVLATLYYSEIRNESNQEYELSPYNQTIVDTSVITFMIKVENHP
jgi:hypothetical protein